jgi:hypothetical protein
VGKKIKPAIPGTATIGEERYRVRVKLSLILIKPHANALEELDACSTHS